MRISKILFTNTPIDDLEEETGSIFENIDEQQLCHICSCNFSLLNSKYHCSVCHLPVCLSDSSFHTAKSRVCDNCQHEILVEEVWAEKKSFKDQIIQHIQETFKENNEKKALIQTETQKIEEFKAKIFEFQLEAEEEIVKLQKFAEELEKVNDDVEKNLSSMNTEVKNRQDFERFMQEKLSKSYEHLQIMKVGKGEMEQEKSQLEREIRELAVPASEQEIDMMFQKVCPMCRAQMRPEMEHVEISGKVCNCGLF